MIEGIALVVALYVLGRVMPVRWRRTSVVISALAGLAACVVAVGVILATIAEPNLFAKHRELTAARSDAAGDAPIATDISPFVTVTRADGGSVATPLKYGYALAGNSSLQREWIAVHDSRMPVDLRDTPGITTVYKREEYSSEYRYRAKFFLELKEPVRAIEVRFLTFDVWGGHVQTLNFALVSDMAVGTEELNGEWHLPSENDAERHYASVGYVARVRLANGTVVRMDEKAVIAEARKFSDKFDAKDLEPESKQDDRASS